MRAKHGAVEPTQYLSTQYAEQHTDLNSFKSPIQSKKRKSLAKIALATGADSKFIKNLDHDKYDNH